MSSSSHSFNQYSSFEEANNLKGWIEGAKNIELTVDGNIVKGYDVIVSIITKKN